MRITELQHYKISESYEKAQSVLNQIKQKALKGENFKAMKLLESAVQHLEIFMIKTAK